MISQFHLLITDGSKGFCYLALFIIVIIFVLIIYYAYKRGLKNDENKQIEFKRTCNNCGKVWFSSKFREAKLYKQAKGANVLALGGLEAASQVQRTRNASESELEKLKSCPDCNSKDYKEEESRIKENK